MLKKAYEDAGVLPNTITFIEAHGTGTPIGDPLEILGLKRCFSPHVKKGAEPFCGVSAIKTNVGHLEGAAGIAGLIKVILSLRAQTLAPLQNFETLNPKIKLEDTPFYLVTKTKPWERLKDPHGLEIPRRAGVNSFGFGGANAHVVIEEWLDVPNKSDRSDLSDKPCLIVLSAKNEDQLKAMAQNLMDYVDPSTLDLRPLTPRLEDVAYTLQVGREAMSERLAMVVKSREELTDKLMQYQAGTENIPSVYRGNIKRDNKTLDLMARGRVWEEFVKAILEDHEWEQLAQLWVIGLTVDWRLLYSCPRPTRHSLPTYPFSRERYWIQGNTDCVCADSTYKCKTEAVHHFFGRSIF